MKLENKKFLVSKALGVGKARIVFNNQRLAEIKEAITKQDIRDLYASKAILVKEIKGRLAVVKRKTRRRAGSIRKKAVDKKRIYIIITRKLRAYLAELKKKDKIKLETYYQLRREIKMHLFKSKLQFKDRMEALKWQKQ